MNTKKIKNTIKRDGFHPALFRSIIHMISCEDCSHFAHREERCTIGYVSQWHQKKFQLEEYNRTGKMALCRFIEID